jgi:hypothetical protein
VVVAAMVMAMAEAKLNADVRCRVMVTSGDHPWRRADRRGINHDWCRRGAVRVSRDDDRCRHMDYWMRCGEDYGRRRQDVTDGVNHGDAGEDLANSRPFAISGVGRRNRGSGKSGDTQDYYRVSHNFDFHFGPSLRWTMQ